MTTTRRRTDFWLTGISIALLVVAPIQNALANDLPTLLPPSVRDRAPLAFLVLLVLIIAVDLALILVRRKVSADSRSRALRRWNLVLTIGLGLLGALAGIVSNLVAAQVPLLEQLSRSHQPWLTVILPIFLLAVLIALPLLAEGFAARPDQGVKDWEAFLHQLSARYLRYLDDPLQRAVQAELALDETPSALQHSVVTTETLDGAPSDTPPGTTTTTATLTTHTILPGKTLLPLLEGAHGQLLILGAPGAGKSTQLAALGRALVRQAESDPTARLPVILDLSTWASNKDPLEQWLAAQITETYEVRKDIAQQWVRTQRILPLLDALDVMAEDDRARCVQAINTYLKDHTSDPLVVCSRREEYDQISGDRLALQQAVTLHPLTDGAIDQALAAGGARVAILRQVIVGDRDLRDAVRTPLLLSLVILTYDDLRAEHIPLPAAGELDAWRHQLLRHYVERMLTHAPGSEQHPFHDDAPTIERTLAWLGYALREHKRNTFYLEQLQPDWLPTAAAASHYSRTWGALRIGMELGVGLAFGLAFGLVSGLAFGLGVGLGVGLIVGLVSGLVSGLGVGLVSGLVSGLGVGLVSGLAFGLVEGLESVHIRQEDLRRPNEGISRSVQSAVLTVLVFGLGVGLAFGLVSGLGVGLVSGLVSGLGVGLTNGGAVALRHLALRRALRSTGVVPRHLVRFLDEACAHVLLRPFGGGYQFIHQLLRDDFAKQYIPPKDQ